MPLGQYPDWDSCIKAQIAKGYSKEAAQGICGLIEKRTKAKQLNEELDEIACSVEEIPI